jgi:competence protein ComEC
MAKRATSIYDHWYKRNQHLFQKIIFALVIFILSTTVLVFEARISSSEGLLRVWFFDVGQGDAIFVEAPTGEQMLIDTGRNKTITSKLGSVMLPWDKTIDKLLLTHQDADHISGAVSVLEKYDVLEVYQNGVQASTPVSKATQTAISLENTKLTQVKTGDVIELGDVFLEVVWPSPASLRAFSKDRNNTSIVLKLIYNNTTILLTGDLEKEGEHELRRLVGDVDVLKVGHHGSLSSTSVEFLDAITPEIGIIPVGKENSYGHPHNAIVKRLIDREIEIFRTDYDGDIQLLSDGNEIKVTSRPLPF